jgi:hypothetical protein
MISKDRPNRCSRPEGYEEQPSHFGDTRTVVIRQQLPPRRNRIFSKMRKEDEMGSAEDDLAGAGVMTNRRR